MRNRLCFVFLLLIAFDCRSQVEFPPVTFPIGKNVCDYTPYKLVFDDEFNGDKIDYSKWRTWNSWAGGDESWDWDQGRWDWAGHAITKDENVVVRDGIAKLIIMHGPERWKCSGNKDCPPHYENYSNGWLTTRYSQYFNSGRFEARLKYPKSDYTWCDMWIYPGMGPNAIDIAEVHGGPAFPFGPFGKTNYFTATYSLHGRSPDDLTDDEIGNRFPNQRWWDHIMGKFFDHDSWHTYTCEWDTALVTFYLDGNLINQIPKYYYMECLPRKASILFFSWDRPCIDVYRPAICATVPGKTYNISRGFPYNNNSRSHLRITGGMSVDETPQDPFTLQYTDTARYIKAETLVDYVRIWQRHPEDDNHTSLCGLDIPEIFGPQAVCEATTFSVNPALGGRWTVAGLDIVSETPYTISVKPASNSNGFGRVVFHYDLPGCIGDSVTKLLDVAAPGSLFFANVIRATNPTTTATGSLHTYQCAYNLFAANRLPFAPVAPTRYHWDVWYGAAYAQHFTSDGRYVSTPAVRYTEGEAGGIRGTLTITNACGSRTIEISRPNQQRSRGGGPQIDSIGNVSYFDAAITDSSAFKEEVENAIRHHFIPDSVTANSAAFDQLIGEAISDALGAYIIPPDSVDFTGFNQPEIRARAEQHSSIYPNPATGIVNIIPHRLFSRAALIDITIADVYGRQYSSRLVNKGWPEPITIDLSTMEYGVYSISLFQDGRSEHLRVVKQ